MSSAMTSRLPRGARVALGFGALLLAVWSTMLHLAHVDARRTGEPPGWWSDWCTADVVLAALPVATPAVVGLVQVARRQDRAAVARAAFAAFVVSAFVACWAMFIGL